MIAKTHERYLRYRAKFIENASRYAKKNRAKINARARERWKLDKKYRDDHLASVKKYMSRDDVRSKRREKAMNRWRELNPAERRKITLKYKPYLRKLAQTKEAKAKRRAYMKSSLEIVRLLLLDQK